MVRVLVTGSECYSLLLNAKLTTTLLCRHSSVVVSLAFSTRKDPKIAGRNDDFFVFAWRQSTAVCPAMFLVGKTNPPGRDSVSCVYDFCIVFPDHSFWQEFKNGGRKAKGPGEAVYVRPFPQD